MTPTDLSALLSHPFTLAVAARHGVGRSVVRRLVRDGEVRRVLHGVYVGAHIPDSVAVRARAAVLVSPRGAVIRGRTAAALHGVPVPVGAGVRLLRPPPIEVAVPEGVSLPRRQGCVGRVTAFDEGEVVRVAGIPVTSAVRTAADVIRTSDRDAGVVVLDAFLRAGLIPPDALGGLAARYARHPGCLRLVTVTRLADPGSASEEESRLRLALADGGAPAAHAGWEIRAAFGRVLHRFVLAWPQERVGLDLTAERHWVRSRVRVLGGRGWLVLDCPAVQAREDPAATVARIVAELRRWAASERAA